MASSNRGWPRDSYKGFVVRNMRALETACTRVPVAVPTRVLVADSIEDVLAVGCPKVPEVGCTTVQTGKSHIAATYHQEKCIKSTC